MNIYQITEDVDYKNVEKALKEKGKFHFKPSKTEDEIIKNCSDAEILISIYEPITAKVIDALKDLKYICVASIGYNAVDVSHAKSKGIYVSNNPSYCIEEVADHTVSLALALERKIISFNKDVKENFNWNYDLFGNTLNRISNLTIGLLGFGSIAREVAKRFKGFNSKIIAYDPYVDNSVFVKAGVEQATLEKIQEEANIISLHLPLTKETEKLINENFIQNLKKSPSIINCSRGQLIDQSIIGLGLEKGYISGLALDVLDSETPEIEKLPFLNNDNVIITPHVAFYSKEAVEEADNNVIKYVSNFIEGNLKDTPML